MIVEVILNENVMTNNEIKEAMKKHMVELEKINSVIKTLQSNCRHLDTDIKSVSDSVMSLRKVCRDCGKEVGYPTPDELKKVGYC